jgi:peptide subunit release factor 1 (eRF1)
MLGSLAAHSLEKAGAMPEILDRSLEPHLEGSIAALLERLTTIPPGPHPVVSCYVRLDPEDRTRNQYLLSVKSRMKELEADPQLLDLSRADRLMVERDLARIRAYLDHPRGLPPARGLALFAAEGLGLWAGVPLPRAHRTRVILDDTPWVGELVAASQDTAPILVAAVDRALARFFTVSPAETAELDSGFTVSGRGGKYVADRKDAPGKGERAYHGRLREERLRHYAMIADRLADLAVAHPAAGIVLAGPSDHTSALHRFLPDHLARRVIGTIRINPTSASPATIQAAACQVAHEHQEKAVARALLALQEDIGSGWAVEGVRETLRALSRGQVRTLYVEDGVQGGGFRCTGTGRLVIGRSDCAEEGEARPIRDIADEAIEDALRQRARVVLAPRGSAGEPIDGLAATLRFR